MGIPEDQVAFFQFTEAKIPPVDELTGNIRVGGGKDLVTGGKNDLRKHEEGKDEENSQGAKPGWR